MARIQWEDAILLEHEVASIIHQQEQHGLYFNLGKANYFLSLLDKLKEEEYSIVRPYLDYDVIIEETKTKREEDLKRGLLYNYVRKIKNKDGSYSSSVIKWYDDPSIIDGQFSRITIEEPSISKRQLVIKHLLRNGWEPELFTEKGQPKLTEKGEPVDSLEAIGDFGKALARWYSYNQRQSSIRGFLGHVREDSTIPAYCNPCATNTFRARHSVVANIPRPTSLFGKEMRSLFGVGEGRRFVGADLSGLELRMLAHHMNDLDYIHQILEGDIHSYNQQKAGLPTRDNAKTFIYGFLYGAGDAKVGSIVGGNSKKGRELKDTFFEAIPALDNLVRKVQAFAKKYGFLPAIDGRKIILRRSEGRVLVHTALNALLQANGSIIAKRAMVIADKEIKRRGLDSHQLLFYHDEVAHDSHPDIADEVGLILTDSMRLAGEYYNLNIPIAGEYKIGMDWGVH